MSRSNTNEKSETATYRDIALFVAPALVGIGVLVGAYKLWNRATKQAQAGAEKAVEQCDGGLDGVGCVSRIGFETVYTTLEPAIPVIVAFALVAVPTAFVVWDRERSREFAEEYGENTLQEASETNDNE